jgi:hypothetical protein
MLRTLEKRIFAVNITYTKVKNVIRALRLTLDYVFNCSAIESPERGMIYELTTNYI